MIDKAERMRKGLLSYEKPMAEIIHACKDGIHQDRFDELFRNKPHPFCGFGDDTFIIGRISRWSFWIDLLNHMIAAEMIVQTGKTPNKVYLLPGGVTNAPSEDR